MKVLAIAAVGYLGLAALAFAFQRRLLFPAPSPIASPNLGSGELIELNTDHGQPVFVGYYEGGPDAPVVVHFHGNGEQLGDAVWLAQTLQSQGLGVVAVEYPGYGPASAQSVSETSIYETAVVAIRWHESEHPGTRLILMGQSLGTGVAVEMAHRGYGDALVLISPYTSIVSMAQRTIPILPAGLLTRDRFDSLAKAPDIEHPTFIVHGAADQLIPVQMAQTLSDRLTNARFLSLPNVGHNDIFTNGPAGLIDDIAAFCLMPPEAL